MGQGDSDVAQPAGKHGHPVVDAAFVVELAQHPNSVVVNELIALHPKLRDDYPRRQEIRGQQVQLHAETLSGAIVHSVGPGTLDGFRFDRLYPDGSIERAIRLEDKKLIIGRPDYRRWEDTWAQVRAVFEMMMPFIMKNGVVTAFQLQFANRFKVNASKENFDPGTVLRRDSEYLIGNIFRVHDFWHSFHGFIVQKTDPHPHALLHVLNVQLLPGADDVPMYLDLHLTNRSNLREGIMDANALLGQSGDKGLLDIYMSSMHDAIKGMLKQALNDETGVRIRLDNADAPTDARG